MKSMLFKHVFIFLKILNSGFYLKYYFYKIHFHKFIYYLFDYHINYFLIKYFFNSYFFHLDRYSFHYFINNHFTLWLNLFNQFLCIYFFIIVIIIYLKIIIIIKYFSIFIDLRLIIVEKMKFYHFL